MRVKLADLTHNMDVKRMNNISEEQMIKYIKKYKPTWDELNSIKLDIINNQNNVNLNNKNTIKFIHRKIYKYMKRMSKMSDLEKAISIALKAHENQKDKVGMPYILHPLHVMMQMETETEKIVAVLHDAMEESDYNFEHLKNEGFDYITIQAIECLTRKNDEDYFKYIDRVAKDAIATKVKIKDLEHNMDLKRFANITEDDILRIVKKYKPAWDKLRCIQI